MVWNMTAELHPKLTVQIFAEEKVFGPGVAQLLRRVEQEQSLRKAAMSMAMAYSKAWTIIKNAERALGFALLHTTVGGRSGGGAQLTDKAKRLLADYEAYERILREEADRRYGEIFGWLSEK